MNDRTYDLTFGELDALVNKWIVDSIEMRDIFECQSEAINKNKFTIDNDNDKLRQINDRLNIIRLYDTILDEDIGFITQSNMVLEQLICHFEAKPFVAGDMEDACLTRKIIYGHLENMFQILNTLSNEAERGRYQMQRVETELLKDPFEQIVRIMTLHLQNLEAIESKIFQLMTLMQKIECSKQVLSCHQRKRVNKVNKF